MTDLEKEACSQWLSKISHDLRTPVTSIMGLTDILMKSDKTPPEHKELLAVMLKAEENLLENIKRLTSDRPF